MNRAKKLALLSNLIAGRLSDREVSDIRKNRETLHLTLDLGDDEGIPDDDDEPSYHIEIWDNWGQTRRYWKYADGRIEEAK